MVTFREDLQRRLADPEFAEAWEETEADFQVRCEIARAREERGMSQAELAAASGMRQEAISRLETGMANPTLSTLQKVAAGLGKRLRIAFVEPAPRG